MSSGASPYGEWVEPGDVSAVPEQLRGERAFAPSSLPADIVLSTAAHRELANAEHAVGRVDEAVHRLPDREMFVLCTRFREVRSSAELVGVDASMLETWLVDLMLTRAAEGVGDPEEVVLDRNPVGRFILASRYGADRLAAGAAIDLELLGAVSARLTGRGPRSLEDGLRAYQGWLGPTPDQAYVLTMPPGERLGRALAEWSAWVGRPHPLSRVGRIALGHLHLELLQPYPEANGHLARIYSSLAMVRSGLVRAQVLPLASWPAARGKGYHARIRAVVEGGPVEEWITFYADGVRTQAEEQLRLMDDMGRLRQVLLERAGGSPAVQRVVAGLVTAPVTSNRGLEAAYGFSDYTASQVTRHLVGKGILEVVDDKSYNKVFVCHEVLDLFTVQRPPAPETDENLFDPPPD
ncbi:Fic family protein [Actinosynnema sp. CS-041913]|uniref:Fic family protein n=1 Tax=Actinosynnema sp. CS-041913 TaxID=3239917 RepID=UPI003D92026D